MFKESRWTFSMACECFDPRFFYVGWLKVKIKSLNVGGQKISVKSYQCNLSICWLYGIRTSVLVKLLECQMTSNKAAATQVCLMTSWGCH
jgi:hypothetical protein